MEWKRLVFSFVVDEISKAKTLLNQLSFESSTSIKLIPDSLPDSNDSWSDEASVICVGDVPASNQIVDACNTTWITFDQCFLT